MDKSVIKRIAKYIFFGIPSTSITIEIKPNTTGKQLKGKNIVITGGSRGIGYAIAKKCIEEGANVLICGRNEDNLKKAQMELGDKCQYRIFDIKNIQ